MREKRIRFAGIVRQPRIFRPSARVLNALPLSLAHSFVLSCSLFSFYGPTFPSIRRFFVPILGLPRTFVVDCMSDLNGSSDYRSAKRITFCGYHIFHFAKSKKLFNARRRSRGRVCVRPYTRASE